MANFPIQYAKELPTGRAAVAPAHIDVRTGEEEIGRAVSELGGALFETGQRIAKTKLEAEKKIAAEQLKSKKKIEDAQKAMEFSTFKRKDEEFRLSALEALKAPGFDVNDDEAVAALREKTNADRNALKSKWQSVNDSYRMYRNGIDPRWNVEFEGVLQDIKAKNVKDEFNLNAENLLGKGKMLEYQTLLETSLATDVISKAEYDFRTKSAPNDSILQQMRIQIGNNNPQIAIELSKQMTDPSADQMDYRDKLLRMSGQMMKQNTDKAEVDVIFNMHANKDKSLIEKAILGNQYISQLSTVGLTGARYGVLVDRIERWMTGEEVKTDLRSYTKIKEALQDLSLGVKDKSEVLDLIMSEMPNLSDTDAKSFIDEAYAKPDKEDKFWEKEAYKTIEKRLLTTDPISGRLFGSTKQYDATDRAKIRFDDAIESAAKTGRPLKGTDYLKKAVEIANQLSPKERKITFGGQTGLPPPEYEEFIIEKPEAILAPPIKYEIGQIVNRAGKQWKIVDFDKDGEPLVNEVE